MTVEAPEKVAEQNIRNDNLEKLQVRIGGMQCSFCVSSIETAFRRMDGVADASVSLSHEEALVQYDPNRVDPESLKDTLVAMGYTWRDPDKVRSFEEEEAELREARNRFLIAASASVIVLALMTVMWAGFRQPWSRWPMLTLALGTMFWPAWHIKKMAWGSLRRRIFNQHVLLEFAAFAGLAGGFIGYFSPEFPIPDFFAVAVLVTTYHLLSGYTSLLVRTRASQSIKRLMDLQPNTAHVIRDGVEEEVPVAEIETGELVRVRPGAAIPIDGVVEDGISGVDQSLVTGESMPEEKGRGDEVIGGSINQTGVLVIRVTTVGSESFLQRIAQHIREARALKPGIVVLVDRVLKFFVPGVVLASIAGFLIWTLGAWLITGDADVSRAVFAALAALVMGYPCALGMATPLAMIRGGGIAARRGILMRSGEAFQAFKDVRKIVLDKTGTITRGHAAVTHVVTVDGWEEKDLLRLAASTEATSEHPLGRSIVEHALDQGLELSDPSAFEAHTGKGVTATIDSREVLVGTTRFLEEQEIGVASLRSGTEEIESNGATVVMVVVDGKCAGFIALRDTVKADAADTVKALKAAGLEPVMVTGDNLRTAQAVATEVGIDQVMAQVLPNEKADRVRDLQSQGFRVAMVGDGINDAPALMQADVGIAIGAGTDIAIESADVVLVGERLNGVVEARDIAKRSYRKTVQNVTLAFMFNGIGVPAAMTGLVHPVWAMIAMAASVTVILANSFGDGAVSLRGLSSTPDDSVVS